MRAQARREQLVEAAARRFAERSYHGATMADLAQSAGVTAALAYRHFPSKAELFAACLDHEWVRLRSRLQAALAGDLPPDERLLAISHAFLDPETGIATLTSLWFQAIAESHAHDAIGEAFERTLRDVHDFVATVAADSQQVPGGMLAERRPDVEAWIFIGIGMLLAADMRTANQVLPSVPAINHERITWMYGPAAAARIFG